MLTNEVTVNIYLLAVIIGLCVFVGFAIRSRVVMKSRSKIEELEREILSGYEYILELERETLTMESRIQDIKSPVIAMKTPNKEMAVSSKKMPDISLRKELLAKKHMGHSATGL